MAVVAWRGVEAQHVVSTMRLVDTAEEQDELERLLEDSLLPLPPMKEPKHQNRFRRAGTLGVYYGA